MLYEFILLSYNEDKNRTERRYGIVYGEDDANALYRLGKWYEILRIEYFACVSEDEDDVVYELNDDWASQFKVTGRKFGKIIPPLNEIPKNNDIYE